ncbi:MAG TPA: DUF1294 domain-containing protein [Phycisphaerales bacterium]|nr:DUF1294 domain-containing protein [Phycisphaerales bacterium]
MPSHPELTLILTAGWYAIASLVTFAAFARDKRAAVAGRRRIPESSLHLAELLGGFPGAIAAMLIVTHKNRKLPFVLVTLLITASHLIAWAFTLSR